MLSRLFRRATPLLIGLVVTTGLIGAAAAQDKVVYHIDDAAVQATKALRNIRNHLDVEPKTTILVVSHAAGIDFLREGARSRSEERTSPKKTSSWTPTSRHRVWRGSRVCNPARAMLTSSPESLRMLMKARKCRKHLAGFDVM